ncbi:hypothetical protein NE237_021296 [Protea cynaroides]|uniref:Protein SIEVE ELEMENT OCCLUSION B-like n=1 Tax=Protea cynaroides TaxID=273540 RepID=A0A9Q0H7K7_9MAGN|nr:hypothetical protein NE237_021296 [Protea cynaroides]
MMRGVRNMRTTFDNNVKTKQILATHAPDGQEFKVKPLLQLICQILQPSTSRSSTTQEGAHPAHGLDKDNFESLASIIHEISCEISCKCSGGGDAHSTTMALLNTMSSYSWAAKVVLALAAFAVTYAEYLLVLNPNSTNPLDKSIARLKQLPDIMEHSETLKSLINTMVNVANCVVKFNHLPPEYISLDQPPISEAFTQIPTAVYWTITSVVAGTSQIIGLIGLVGLTGVIGLSHEYIQLTIETRELSNLSNKVNDIHDQIREQLNFCHQYIEDKKHNGTYQTLVRLFKETHIDNMKILKALIFDKDDLLSLFECTSKRHVGIEVLKWKNVLLLISDLDMSEEELSILKNTYKKSRALPTGPESQYQVVWLPVADSSVSWTEERQKVDRLQSKMPWYSVYIIDQAVIKYIKDVWMFNKKPILVALDPHGKVISLNAFHMMCIWGNDAFPFTREKEEELWRNENRRLEFLDYIIVDPQITTSEYPYICLYGGEDMQWIKEFTEAASRVAIAEKIKFEMVYLGKSNLKDRVSKNIELNKWWPNPTYFWIRLESMWYSMIHHQKTIDKRIKEEIMTMLTFNSSKKGWALICQGSAIKFKAKGDTILKLFQDYEQCWKVCAEQKGFLNAANEHLEKLGNKKRQCSQLILPSTFDWNLDPIHCVECDGIMEKFVMYRCCN